MCSSREGAQAGVSSTDCRFVYLRMPSAPCREPRPDSFQPPIGSSSAP